jgi:hypothetical protein
MDKIIDALDGPNFYERIKSEYKLKTSSSVLDVIVETGFLVDPCEDTLQSCLRLVEKYSGDGFPSDLGDYYRATPLLILMGYYDTLPRGFVARCVKVLFDTENSWNPRPYCLHCNHEIEFLEILWKQSGFQQEFNLSMTYLMQNNKDRDVLKRIKAFQMRESTILYKMFKKLEKLGKISI